jgi:hypothetical protein
MRFVFPRQNTLWSIVSQKATNNSLFSGYIYSYRSNHLQSVKMASSISKSRLLFVMLVLSFFCLVFPSPISPLADRCNGQSCSTLAGHLEAASSLQPRMGPAQASDKSHTMNVLEKRQKPGPLTTKEQKTLRYCSQEIERLIRDGDVIFFLGNSARFVKQFLVIGKSLCYGC